MANKNPSPKTRIQKGQVLNPEGGRTHDPIKKRLRRLTQFELQQLGSMFLDQDEAQIKKIMKDKKDSVLRRTMAGLMLDIMQYRDEKKITLVFDRTAGKVSDKLIVGVDDETEKDKEWTEEQELAFIKKHNADIDLTDDE